MTIEEDDAAILAAAVALCWHARPVMAFGPGLGQISCRTAQEWWNVQPEMERRLHIGRACVDCEAWEAYWKERGR